MEKDIRRLLKRNQIAFESQKSFDWLVLEGKLFIDFFVPDYGGACPKSTPSVSSTPCQNSPEGRLHFEKRTFRTAWGGIYTFMICSALKEIHIYIILFC